MNTCCAAPETFNVSGDIDNLFVLNRSGGNSIGAGSRIIWSAEQIDYIVKHYEENHNVKELANLFATSQESMRKLLHKQGIETILNCDKDKILRPRNSNYFEEINTPDKAYWLGFLYADGYVNEKTYQLRINLQRRDEEHLEKFLRAVDATNIGIKRTVKKTSDKIYEGSYVTFGDKKMIQDLVGKGCMQNKSFILKFPAEEQVPKELLSHFIRGYFDGDGTIIFRTHATTGLKYFSIGLLGTEDFLQGVQQFLNRTHLKLEDRKTHYALHIVGNKTTYEALNILYKNSYKDIELTRKREKYEMLVEQRRTIKTYSNTLVTNMQCEVI